MIIEFEKIETFKNMFISGPIFTFYDRIEINDVLSETTFLKPYCDNHVRETIERDMLNIVRDIKDFMQERLR